jgi:uncharacterized protein with gpF-like domain
MRAIFLALFALAGSADALAQAKAPRKKTQNSGADSEEGWIIRKTKDGVVKVPRKQNFSFGSDVQGQGAKPAQSVIGQRPTARETTLIPVRQSFRQEVLDSVGYRGTSKPAAQRSE